MSCGTGCKCDSRGGLCPVSFGMALGLTCALGAFFFSLWVMYYGMPAMMAGRVMPEATYMGALTYAFWALIKGFVMGFFVAFFYNFISCYCKAMCCKKSDASCGSSDKSAGDK